MKVYLNYKYPIVLKVQVLPEGVMALVHELPELLVVLLPECLVGLLAPHILQDDVSCPLVAGLAQ